MLLNNLKKSSLSNICIGISDKRQGVDWLLISLKDGLEDVETSREDVALVPLSETAASAVDDPLFINLMEKLSFKKPSQQVSIISYLNS